MPRIFCPAALQPAPSGQVLVLRDAAARHVQVLRLQPGDALTLFDGGAGAGGEFAATVIRMGRSEVEVRLDAHRSVEREPVCAVHLALGVPTGDRMDWLVEKATELGVASIQPLMTERSVLRLSGERAVKKVAHWQGIAVAACEQCGRNRVPRVHPVCTLDEWLAAAPDAAAFGLRRHVLSLKTEAAPWATALAAGGAAAADGAVALLSGPEGGLSTAEEARACAAGLAPVSLGPRILRADTAPLAALALATLRATA